MFFSSEPKSRRRMPSERRLTRCGMFHVHNRWLGGTLTNFSTIRQSIDRLRKLEEMENDPENRRGFD